jgi:hypothetical protein
MFQDSIVRGTENALDWFSNEGTVYFALYVGSSTKDPVLQNLKGKYEEMDECIEKLKKYFNCITPGPKTVYILKWWDEKPEFNKGKVISTCDGSVKFITNTDEEVNEYVSGYRERNNNYSNAILSRLEAIEQKISNNDQEEETQPEHQGLSGIVNNPEFQTMLVQYIGAIVDRIIPIKKQSVAINGFDDNKLDQALLILKKHDPELENDLMILANMAENNPGQFKFLLSMLRK